MVVSGVVVRRHELPGLERELLAPLMPRAVTGRPRVEDRQVVNGMVGEIRTGISWRDLPERHGPWKTAYTPLRPLCARQSPHPGSAADPGPCGCRR
ncbi:transposase [Streptomyces hygroscopicus]|uniref:transposase n=1 Tax=Streptomyces hygroscopicus TaxID=1912 RepID=UPI0034060769